MASIYVKDSIVGSFKYSASSGKPLVIYNNVISDLKFETTPNNTYNILFKVVSLNIKSGVLQKYVLSRRIMLKEETQWGSWEVIFEKNSYCDNGYYMENNFNQISNSNFVIDQNKYQFKLELFDLNNNLGKLTSGSSFTNIKINKVDIIPDQLISQVETFSFDVTNDSIPISIGSILNFPTLNAYNLPVYDRNQNKCFVSLYPIDSNGKITLTENYIELVGLTNTTLKQDAVLLITDNNRPYYTVSGFEVYNSIYGVPNVQYFSGFYSSTIDGDYLPEPPTYRATSHALTEQNVNIYFGVPVDIYKAVYQEYVSFLDIKNNSKNMDLGYLNNIFYKNCYVKVYIFIPAAKYDQDAEIDLNPVNGSNLGTWFFKEQFKLADLKQVGASFKFDNTEFIMYKYLDYELPLKNLPKDGRVFYIWLGIGFEKPELLLTSNYEDIAKIPTWR